MTHNKKYNDMLAERMRKEDALQEQVDGLSLKLSAMTASKESAEAKLEDATKAWAAERASMQEEFKVRVIAWAMGRRLRSTDGGGDGRAVHNEGRVALWRSRGVTFERAGPSPAPSPWR